MSTVLSATAFQAISDKLAAKIQAALTGFANESSLATVASLYDLAVAGGADITASVGKQLRATDRFGYPENYSLQLASLFARPDLMADALGLVAHVQSKEGGSYASFTAYVTDKAPTIHPLVAQLIRGVGGDLLGLGTTPVGVFAPAYQAAFPAQILIGADGALTDKSSAATGITATTTCFVANTNKVYLRSRQPFNRIVLGLSTLASASITPTFFYWNGTSYAALTVTDNSAGFQNNDTISFTPPTDWEPNYKDSGGTVFPNNQERLYTVYVQRGNAAGITQPIAACATLCGISQKDAAGRDYGLPQPPLALIRIPSANTIVLDVLVAPDTLSFVPPAIRFRSLSALGATDTFTASYTNQAGAAQTQAQSGWVTPAALATVSVSLNGSDTGVKAILPTGWLVTASASGLGVVAVEVVPVRSPAI